MRTGVTSPGENIANEEVIERKTGTKCPICKEKIVEVMFQDGETIIPGNRYCPNCGTIIFPLSPAPQILQ